MYVLDTYYPLADWNLYVNTDPTISGRAFEIQVGVYHLESTEGHLFGASLYGTAPSDCAYGYPAGYCIKRFPVSRCKRKIIHFIDKLLIVCQRDKNFGLAFNFLIICRGFIRFSLIKHRCFTLYTHYH